MTTYLVLQVSYLSKTASGCAVNKIGAIDHIALNCNTEISIFSSLIVSLMLGPFLETET